MNQKFLKFFLYASIISLFCSCDSSCGNCSDISEDSLTEDSQAADFIKVRAKGMETTLGTNLSSANSKDRPEMKVKFDYDFSMGKHEVTCKEFNELMNGRNGLELDCENGTLPATNVNFYDAVLFANARSVNEKLDTAYTYTSASFDSKGNCLNLEGFAFHPETNGYRLPTEAEWVLAASIKWDPSTSWNSENSEYKPHAVCTSGKKDGLKFCDMAGNVMEWVNDWFGNLQQKKLTNYVGAPDGGNLGQRVLKGGSFRNAPNAINLYSRGDVYTVTSKSKESYVGFRLARGSIPEPVWMSSDGVVGESRIITLANSSTVKSITKTYFTKLAFRNDITKNIAYIDYSKGNVSIKEIQDTIDAYHPDISPDGKWVAFCTLFEGLSGKSRLYVRKLTPQGENLVELDVSSAAIPRWRVLDNGDTAIVYVSSPQNNEDESQFKKESTWQVSFKNGKFGEPEKLFDGAYHGGVSADNNLAISGSQLLRARITEGSKILDTVWYNSEQACNASINKDNSKRTLFLDFGSSTKENFVGQEYAAHKFILVADSTGKTIQAIPAPSGYTFDHSEWTVGNSSQNELIVATLENRDGAHSKIVLVNAKDSSIVELAEGDELWHPALWVDAPRNELGDVSLDLDSAGVYLVENSTENQAHFRVKIEHFWRHIETTEVLLMGSSRMEIGIRPDLYPERKMFNWGIVGIDPIRDYYFAQHYGMTHIKNLKAIVFALDLDGWQGNEDHLATILEGIPGYQYDANHQFWADYLPDYFIEAVSASYPASETTQSLFTELGGWRNEQKVNTNFPVQVMRDSIYTEKEMAALDYRLDYLATLVDKAAEKNIHIVGILMPLAVEYKNTGSYGPYGLQRSIARKKIAWLDSLGKASDFFTLMDENKMGAHDYGDLFFDQDHLSDKGASKITSRLDSLLGTLK